MLFFLKYFSFFISIYPKIKFYKRRINLFLKYKLL